jgi:hypothetical protein
MEEKFQHIIDNWFNGNRKDSRKGYQSLNDYEREEFSKWILDQYYESAVPDDYFKFVLSLI